MLCRCGADTVARLCVLCISLFSDVKPGARAASFKKRGDRVSRAALRSPEKALLEKKGEEGRSDALEDAHHDYETRSAWQKFQKK